MRYEENRQRQGRSGMLTRQGNRTPREIRGLILLGPAFLFTGMVICWFAFGTWKIQLTQTGPDWVGKVGGVGSLVAGLGLCAFYFLHQKKFRRRLQPARCSAAELAMADYDWDEREYQPARKRYLLWRTIGPMLVTLLGGGLSYLWWSAGSGELEHGSKVGVAITAVVLDVVAVCSWLQWLVTFARTVKYGDSRIEFTRFPYSLTGSILIRWQPPTGINQPRAGSFTLRCVEEWRVQDTDRRTTLYQDELWSGTWRFSQNKEWTTGELIDFTFEPREEARPTCLSAERPVFWEFEVKLEMPGPDFVETYLVPIYA